MAVSSHAATSSWTDHPAPSPRPVPTKRPSKLEISVAKPGDQLPSSPPSDSISDEDDILYGDREDAQSFIQPAISPVATRLTSPRTPAAERAAVMEVLHATESFDGAEDKEPLGPRHTGSEPVSAVQSKQVAKTGHDDEDGALSLGSLPLPQNQDTISGLPSPWHPGQRGFVVDDPKARKPSMTGVFGGPTRHQRASSIGEIALKRISKAFDSMNLPTFTSPSFFSSASTNRDDQPALSSSQTAQARSVLQRAASGNGRLPQGSRRPSSEMLRKSVTLRRTNSEDSTLYHSLSRVSSFGDDDRFTHIREQVNVRLKAIKDSWDGPSFKLPNIIPESLKSGLLGGQSDSPPGPSRTGSSTVLNSANSALDNVLESLTGDIVILGGYRGSVLRSSHPPYRQLWVPVKVGLNIRKVNLEVGLDPEDEEDMEKHIFASGMLKNIGPVDISKRLFKKVRDCENAKQGKLRVHDYGYDWRLSPHLLSRKLVEFLETLPSNQPDVPPEKRGALVIAHSLGGLITRHAVNQRPELFSGVLYAGTPQRCINILGPIRNGDAVLLNEKVLTAQVHFSLRTTFVFLPEDGFCFVDKHTGEEHTIDFYNVDDWIKYRLSPCVSEPPLPPLLSKTSTSFAPLRSLSGSFPNLPLRGRSNSDGKKTESPTRRSPTRKPDMTKDRTLAPQILSFSSPSSTQPPSPTTATLARNISYLRHTLAQTKLFRSQLAHDSDHQASNRYPPIAVLYGKEIPTVYAARVCGGREAIPCADAYDDLLFRSGDGVVLAREAMPPAGYEIVRGGRISTDRGHITMLGDLGAVGRGLEAVLRGRRKGIGLGKGDEKV